MIGILALILAQAAPVAEEAQAATETESPAADPAGEVDAPQDVKAASQTIVVTGEKDEDNAMICRKEKVIGSNIPKRVCRTAAQIKAEAEAAKSYARDAASNQATRRAGNLNSYQ